VGHPGCGPPAIPDEAGQDRTGIGQQPTRDRDQVIGHTPIQISQAISFADTWESCAEVRPWHVVLPGATLEA
jgi:hypothetical protein